MIKLKDKLELAMRWPAICMGKRRRHGGVPIMVIIAGAVAVLAIAAAGFLFMQMQSLKKKVAVSGEVQPRGLEPESAEEVSHAEAIHEEPATVTYELGKFTANTADARHASMTVALSLESFYSSEDWASYQAMKEAYDAQVEFFNSYQRGEVDESGKPKKKGKGGHASLPGDAEGDAGQTQVLLTAYHPGAQAQPLTGVVPAGHGEKKAEPPKLPEVVPLPKTIFEKQLDEKSVEVRDMVIDEINKRSAAELSSPEGKASFKAALMEGIGRLIDAHYGSVKEVYLPEIVTG